MSILNATILFLGLSFSFFGFEYVVPIGAIFFRCIIG